MILRIQILSFFVSFLYGIFFGITVEINDRFLYSSYKFFQILFSFVFIVFHTLLYFLLLLKINFGYVHFYFFLCVFLGYLLCQYVYKWFVKHRNL